MTSICGSGCGPVRLTVPDSDGLVDGPGEGADLVLQGDPAPVLPARAQRSGQARAGPGAAPGPSRRRAGPGRGRCARARRAGRRPRPACWRASQARTTSQRNPCPVGLSSVRTSSPRSAVDADRRPADQRPAAGRGRPARPAPSATVCGAVDARGEDLLLVRRRPPVVADAGAGEVDHRVDAVQRAPGRARAGPGPTGSPRRCAARGGRGARPRRREPSGAPTARRRSGRRHR